MERTLVLLKPDAVQRHLIGPILTRFEQKGLKLVGLKLRCFPLETIQQHYSDHASKPFYRNLVGFMTSGPVVAMAFDGRDAIPVVRALVGATNAREAAPGTIRGDFGMSFSNNMVHASDSPGAAAKELELFFGEPDDLIDWEPVDLGWSYNIEEELS
ncbi:MAG TPA: nucleoside-diphosphate kinase [Planctomycetes bacterium]|nr:nucleoside-diphosphate kinase [Planctomycetota bacterium]HIL53146.1 nucleoside-diphosphate kinase [Planctomycetota bacterium]